MKTIRQTFATHSQGVCKTFALFVAAFVSVRNIRTWHFQEFGGVDDNQSQPSSDICKDPQAFLTNSQKHRFLQAPPHTVHPDTTNAERSSKRGYKQ